MKKFKLNSSISTQSKEFIQIINDMIPTKSMQAAGTYFSYQALVKEFTDSVSNDMTEMEYMSLVVGTLAKLNHYWVDNFSKDARKIVDMVEQAHPIFILQGIANEYDLPKMPVLTEDYQAIRDEYLSITSDDMTRAEFTWATRRYFLTFQDGHMAAPAVNSLLGIPNCTSGFINISWRYCNGNLYLLNDQGYVTQDQVIEIGGASVADVLNQVDLHFFAENEAGREWLYTVWSSYISMVLLAGGECAGDMVDILVVNEGEEIVKTITIVAVPMWFEKRIKFMNMPLTDSIVADTINDNIFHIDVRGVMNDGPHVDHVESAIEEAMTKGIRHYVLDLRGAPGGNSAVGERLLRAMGVTLPTMGTITRASDTYVNWLVDLMESDFIVDENLIAIFEEMLQSGREGLEAGHILELPDLKKADNSNNVFVSVLTDVETYSSAMTIAFLVRDGGFGNVIGTPSRQAPMYFAQMMAFDVSVSALTLQVSAMLTFRPDPDADQYTLMPDILVSDEDALDVAVEFLRELMES